MLTTALKTVKTALKTATGALALWLVLGVTPVMGAELQADKDYRVINPPLAVDGKGQIEVTEFFWYGCTHCFDFEPVISVWVKGLPADVSFRREPAIFPNNKWVPGARLYYTLEAMNVLEKHHSDVFAAIHLDRARLDNEKTLQTWIGGRGIDIRKFNEHWNSPAIQARVQGAKEASLKAGVTGVPGVMVQGRYLAISHGNYEDLLKVVDQLIDRVRTETRKK